MRKMSPIFLALSPLISNIVSEEVNCTAVFSQIKYLASGGRNTRRAWSSLTDLIRPCQK